MAARARQAGVLIDDLLKRTIDFIVAAIGLALLSPLFIAIALAIKVFSPGPVFFRGKRAGLRGELFGVLKFRSMIVDAESRGGSATAEDDPRVTRFGTVLRKYKMDELPQLVNVLRGEMSLVGPRPEVEKYVRMYTGAEADILTVRPGMTDWASLWNFDEGAVLAGSPHPEADYERLIRPTKLHLQLLYVRNRSTVLDLKILFHTAAKLLLRHRWIPAEIKEYSSLYGSPAMRAGIPASLNAPDSLSEVRVTPYDRP